MGVPLFNVHQQVSEADQASLRWLAEEVNRCFFGSKMDLPVVWGIPSASEADEPKMDIGALSDDLKKNLQVALNRMACNDYIQARDALLPLVENKHTEASKLYVKVLQKLDDSSWEDVARSFNRVSTDTLFVPAGSTESRDGKEVIIIHQSLSKSIGYDAPKCVIRYALHHEMLHKRLGTDHSDPHPQVFRRLEACFPERKRCVRWLKKHLFTTLEG
ncbi:hypothetical protein [Pseudomonas baetica]|uniref:hypothetical protein n=1 Tax=Pseudomonas baetica TaxID=674054 RepID=UPI0024075B3A|nr:hypothetical protein [Pseudomonas baetica]MDF9778815.1 hypothetical protein [Pseudomonas baetica]